MKVFGSRRVLYNLLPSWMLTGHDVYLTDILLVATVFILIVISLVGVPRSNTQLLVLLQKQSIDL